MKQNLFTEFITYVSWWFSKWQMKLIFGAVAFVIVLAIIFFTQSIVSKLIEREQDVLSLYTEIYEEYVMPYVSGNYNTPEEFNELIVDFLFQNITPKISFPVIMTNSEDVPITPYESWTLNISLDEDLTVEEQIAYLSNYVQDMKRSYKPFVVKNSEGEVVQKIYYTHSQIVDVLRYFPILALIVITTFVFIGYIAFSTSRKSEQHKVWVGMAKEAAHQLGTPLSSLMAWLEIISYSKDDPKQIEDSITEMRKDVDRLSIIATRFSKIGSEPEMQIVNIGHQIESVIRYFERRLPHIGKRIEIERELNYEHESDLNPELFNWVFENLLKNAAEAIEGKHGTISIKMSELENRKISIEITDNGKGMNKRTRNQIFQPGFTTKKRGWGLGLSLTRRIVEDYHKGKIYVKESQPGKGTTFVIELNERNSV